VAVLPLTFTVPVTAAPPIDLASAKLAFVSVALFIGSEKVADTEEFVATPFAALAGNVVDTVGTDDGGGSESELSGLPPPQAASTKASTGTSSKAFAGKIGILIPSFLDRYSNAYWWSRKLEGQGARNSHTAATDEFGTSVVRMLQIVARRVM
jgi:hypothetical protein